MDTTGLVLVTGPRGSGKSHLIGSTIDLVRDRGLATWWIDAAADISPRELAIPATRLDVVALDGVDPQNQAHRGLLHEVSLRVRHGMLGTAIVSSRSAEITNPEVHGPVIPRQIIGPHQLTLTGEAILRAGRTVGLELTEEQLAAIVDASARWSWIVKLGISVTRANPGIPRDQLRAAIDRRALGIVNQELVPRFRGPLTITRRIDLRVLQAAGVEDPRDWLTAAETAGWVERDDRSPIYRVPAPLTDLLRRGDVTRPRTSRSSGIHLSKYSRVVTALTAELRISEAVDIALHSGNVELIHEVALAAATHMRLKDLQTVAESLRHRDQAWFGTHVDLLCLTVLFDCGSDGSAQRRAARRVATLAHTVTATPIARLLLHAALTVLHRVVGDLGMALEAAGHLLDEWHTHQAQGHYPPGAAAIGLDAAAMTFLMAGDYRRANDAAEDAVACATGLHEPLPAQLCGWHLAAIHAFHGDISAAHQTMRLLPPLEQLDVPAYFHISSNIGLALVAVEDGDVAAASQRVQAAMTTGNLDQWWLTRIAEAVVARAAGETQVARTLSAKVSVDQRRGRLIATRRYQLQLATFLITDGRFAAARRLLTPWEQGDPEARILNGVIDLATGSYASARRRALPDLADAAPRTVVLRGLVLAGAAAGQHQHDLAAEHLAATAQRMQEWGLTTPLRYLTEPLRTLLEGPLRTLVTSPQKYLRVHLARTPSLPSQHTFSGLTGREQQVLDQLATGATIDETAGRLGVSRNTVKTLTRRLYRKLRAQTRQQAIDRAATAGILDELAS